MSKNYQMTESRPDRLAKLKLLLSQEQAETHPSCNYIEDLKLSIKYLERSMRLVGDYKMVKT